MKIEQCLINNPNERRKSSGNQTQKVSLIFKYSTSTLLGDTANNNFKHFFLHSMSHALQCAWRERLFPRIIFSIPLIGTAWAWQKIPVCCPHSSSLWQGCPKAGSCCGPSFCPREFLSPAFPVGHLASLQSPGTLSSVPHAPYSFSYASTCVCLLAKGRLGWEPSHLALPIWFCTKEWGMALTAL